MKPTQIIFLLFIVFLSATNIKAQNSYPHFQKHYVLDGETTESIAEQFQVPVGDFCLLNDFPQDVKLKYGQLVLIRMLKAGEKEIVESPPVSKTAEDNSTTISNSNEKSLNRVEETTENIDNNKTEENSPVSRMEADNSTSATTISENNTSIKTEEIVGSKDEELREDSKLTRKNASYTELEKDIFIPKEPSAQKKEMPALKKEAVTSQNESKVSNTFIVPPPSTKSIEIGPNGTKYIVSKSDYHIVEKNQTFFRIALIYGMSVEELKELNNLNNTIVEIGQKLRIRKD